jgi:hypothetical protein
MDWLAALDDAAAQFNGGARSFPAHRDAAVAHRHGYDPPNEDYQKLFRQATVSSSQRDASLRPCSAGWLVPEEGSVCRPVFVAHSALAAIWLLRATLPDDALSSSGWESLVSAATSLAQGDEPEVPPSAQKPQSATAAAAALSQRGKRAAPPSTPGEGDDELSLKRARLDDSTPPTSPAPSALSVLSVPSEPGDNRELEQHAQRPALHTTVTVTNNNRRAERERSRKLERKKVEKRRELGLIEPDAKAPRQERAAYASIPLQDETSIAWIIKQPIPSKGDKVDFYTAARTPYYTASAILERARTLGNPSSRYHAAQFLQAWRERGSPFRQGASGGNRGSDGNGGDDDNDDNNGSSSRDHPQTNRQKLLALLTSSNKCGDSSSTRPRSAVDSAFFFAWTMCNRSEGELAAVHIEYRWAAALLGKAYADKMAQLRHNDFTSSNDRTRNRYGKGLVSTEALVSLLKLVNPNPNERDRLVLRKRLAKASRWYTVAQTLGWGSLTLMPHDLIPNTWIESTLRTGELAVWLELIKKEHPDIFTASKALEAWLGPDGIAGGPISSKKTLSIEAEAPSASSYEIEEVQDSDDEGDDDAVTSQTQIPPDSPVPAAPLRQMTLLELFHPVD